MKLSDFGKLKPHYIDVIVGLKNGDIAGQWSLPLDGEVELILNVVHPLEPTPLQLHLQKRQEALTLINGNKVV